MQVSALNLIIAAQQARNQTAPRPAPQAAPTTSSPSTVAQAPVAEAPAQHEFAPMAFKSEGASKTSVQGEPANGYSPTAPLGSQIDIRI